MMNITFKQFLKEQQYQIDDINTIQLVERKIFQSNDVSYKIAKQMVTSALENSPNDGEALAKKLAANFYHQILNHIEDELHFHKNNKIRAYTI
jgi:hypothetical protein